MQKCLKQIEQLLHDSPPMPHAVLSLPPWHMSFASQQPPGQLASPQVPAEPPPPPVPDVVHMPAEHVDPAAQATQVTPLLPQAALVAGEVQTLP